MKWTIVYVTLLLALFTLGGCITPWGMNMDTQQRRQVKESEAAEALASSDTTYKGPLEKKINETLILEVTGDGATGAIIQSEKENEKKERSMEELIMEYHHAQNKTLESESKGTVEEEASFTQKNPYTLVLIGVGLILIPVGLFLIWKLIKATPAGNAIKLVGQGVDTVIESVRARVINETDPVKKEVLKDVLIEAEHNRNTVTNGETK